MRSDIVQDNAPSRRPSWARGIGGMILGGTAGFLLAAAWPVAAGAIVLPALGGLAGGFAGLRLARNTQTAQDARPRSFRALHFSSVALAEMQVEENFNTAANGNGHKQKQEQRAKPQLTPQQMMRPF